MWNLRTPGAVFMVLFLLGQSTCDGWALLPFSNRPSAELGDAWLDTFLGDPFRVLEQIPLGLERDESAALIPAARVDWKETTEGHVISLDVPGLKKEELKIEVDENRVLRVSGERKREEEKKGDHWHRVERSYGKFFRQFRLPENADLDTIQAKLENGVLTISFSTLSPDRIKGPKVVSIAATDEEAERLPEKPSGGGGASSSTDQAKKVEL